MSQDILHGKSYSIDHLLDAVGWQPIHSKILLLCTLGYFACGAEFTLLSLVGAETRDYFQVSLTEFGVLASAGNAASLMAGISFGALADRFGRKQAFIIAQLLVCLGGVAAVFSPTWIFFIAARCICSFGLGGLQVLDFVLLAELLPPKEKSAKAQWVFLGGCAGFIYLASADWGLRRFEITGNLLWRSLTLLAVLPMIPALIMRLCLRVESPRWLLRKNRIQEARHHLMLISGATESVNYAIEAEINKIPAAVNSRESVISPTLLLIAIAWAAQGAAYSGGMPFYKDLLRNGNFFSPESVMILVAVAEVPGVLLAGYFARKYGPKIVLIGFFMMSLIAAIACLIFRNSPNIFIFSISSLFFFHIPIWGLLFSVSPDLFPPAIRGRAVGFCSMAKAGAGVGAPLLFRFFVEKPTGFFGLISGMMGLGGIGALLLFLHTRPTDSKPFV